MIVKLQYFDADGTSTLGNVQEFTVEEITTGKFMKALPIEVLTDTGSDRTLRDIFKYIIQAQIRDSKIETKEIFKDGWHKNKYHGQADKNISKEEEYKVAVKMATVLGKRNNAVAAVVLAAIHGPVKRVFQSAGIQHDFVTFVTGKTGIGKTALVKQICNYRQDTGVVFALSSERKELRKTLQNISDTTIVIDDFNISGSDRMASRQLQIISEIIQAACDSGGVILDETSLDKMDNCIHIVVTSEKLIRNLSTINRCFLVNMQESIPKDLWDEIFHMKEQNYFRLFKGDGG